MGHIFMALPEAHMPKGRRTATFIASLWMGSCIAVPSSHPPLEHLRIRYGASRCDLPCCLRTPIPKCRARPEAPPRVYRIRYGASPYGPPEAGPAPAQKRSHPPGSTPPPRLPKWAPMYLGCRCRGGSRAWGLERARGRSDGTSMRGRPRIRSLYWIASQAG
jgi:hypothetical protein